MKARTRQQVRFQILFTGEVYWYYTRTTVGTDSHSVLHSILIRVKTYSVSIHDSMRCFGVRGYDKVACVVY